MQSGVPLSQEVLVASIREALISFGLQDVSQFNSHSFKIGVATAAAQAGIADSTIQLMGRWRSAAFTQYIHPPVQEYPDFRKGGA